MHANTHTYNTRLFKNADKHTYHTTLLPHLRHTEIQFKLIMDADTQTSKLPLSHTHSHTNTQMWKKNQEIQPLPHHLPNQKGTSAVGAAQGLGHPRVLMSSWLQAGPLQSRVLQYRLGDRPHENKPTQREREAEQWIEREERDGGRKGGRERRREGGWCGRENLRVMTMKGWGGNHNDKGSQK